MTGETPAWWPLHNLNQLERRSDIVIEGRPLLVLGKPGDPLAFPEDYVNATIQEAQDALRVVKGVKTAKITITIRVEPYCEILVQRI